MSTGERYWMGSRPTACDVCGGALDGRFYDMATVRGPWGILCHGCAFGGVGVGRLGTGAGQRYEWRLGKYVKTGG